MTTSSRRRLPSPRHPFPVWLACLVVLGCAGAAQATVRDPVQAFAFLDTDGDGTLSSPELRRTGMAASYFAMDANGDGAITREEFERYLGVEL